MSKPVKNARKKRGLSVKNEAERVRLETLIETNEERLESGLASNGEPLSDKQKTTLGEVIKSQREKLDQIHELMEAT